MDSTLAIVNGYFTAFQARNAVAAAEQFAADAKMYDDTATVHKGTEELRAFFKNLFDMLPNDTTQLKRFDFKVEGNTVLLWWSADSAEAMFDMHDTYTVANGKIVLASSGGTRKIKK